MKIIELRRYALHPGQREVLIELFDRELVETQEATGMAVLGQFRDLDDPDSFVWLRGFPDLSTRRESLAEFYYGPAWKAHAREANATMVDSDNVLLLRPVRPDSGFPRASRPPVGAPAPRSAVLATIYYRDRPFDGAFVESFEREGRARLAGAGAAPVAWFQTEYAENTFPQLPVRTEVNAFVWFARFPSVAELDHHLEHSPGWDPDLTTERLRLTPTGRSLLR
jgi:hypothetical protein